MDLGAAVAAARVELKLSQSELGALASITRQTVALIETNRGRVATFDALAQHVALSIYGLPSGLNTGERLRFARIARGMSLRHAANTAEIAVNSVREIEAGRGTLGNLARLAKIVAPRARAFAVPGGFRGRGVITVGKRPTRLRHPSDYYPTPAAIVRLLLDHEEFDRTKTVLEPTVGDARIIERILYERGFKDVVCFDLQGDGTERRDFFDIQEPYHTIITNPPFSLHREFILHAKRIATHKIAFLLPLNYLTGALRHFELWTDVQFPLARVHVLNRGIDFISSDPHADRFHASQIYCAWFIFEKSHRGSATLHWIDSHQHVERKRR